MEFRHAPSKSIRLHECLRVSSPPKGPGLLKLSKPRREAVGVHRVLELLEAEVGECLGLLGADRFAVLDRACLHSAQPTALPHVLSAFPLLRINGEGF
jgi:hypothetical protein